jgi:hypothetical protein
MTRRDRELLDKQFRWQTPKPRNNGVLILALVGVFVAGIALSGSVSAPERKPVPGSPSYLLR